MDKGWQLVHSADGDMSLHLDREHAGWLADSLYWIEEELSGTSSIHDPENVWAMELRQALYDLLERSQTPDTART